MGGSLATDSAALLDDALAGDRVAMRQLVARLTPVVQARAARCLGRHGLPSSRRNIREEVADLTQEVFVHLFEHDARILRSYKPEVGASVETFVGLVAQRRALSLLRTRKHSPWTEDPSTDVEELLPLAGGPEALVASQEILSTLLAEVEAELSPLGLELFQRLVIDEQEVPQIVEETGMKRNAVYGWRSRLTKLIREKAARIMSDPERAPRTSP